MEAGKILVIMPKFDRYGDEIREQSRYSVDVLEYDEYNLISRILLARLLYAFLSLFNAVRVINRASYRVNFASKNFRNLNQYIKKEVEKLSINKYSEVIWVKCDGISDDTYDYVVNAIPGRHVLYLYDPIVRYPDILRNFKRFEAIFTFDPSDAKQYHIKHLPMFRHKVIANVQAGENTLYCASFVGEFSWFRLFLLLKSSKRLALPCKFILVSKWLPNINLLGVGLTSQRIEFDDIQKIYRQSACMFEISNPGQGGITQRFHDAYNLNLCLVSLGGSSSKYADITFQDLVSQTTCIDRNLKLLQESLARFKKTLNKGVVVDVNDFIEKLISSE